MRRVIVLHPEEVSQAAWKMHAHLRTHGFGIRSYWFTRKHGHESCVFEVDAISGLNDLVKSVRADLGADALVIDEWQLRQPGLAVFDMDSTLIPIECIDELARLHGVEEEVSQITAEAMRGNLDFRQSLARRLAMLKGLPQEKVMALAQDLPLMPGAAALIAGLRAAGWKTAILSGGFTVFVEELRRRLGVDFIRANQLQFDGDRLSGEVQEPVVDADLKMRYLRQIAEEQGIPLINVMAVGDGANDLPMIMAAGAGFAFHAKPKVEAQAPNSLRHCNLDALLHVLPQG